MDSEQISKHNLFTPRNQIAAISFFFFVVAVLVYFRLCIVANGYPWWGGGGNSARIQDETSESSAWFFSVFGISVYRGVTWVIGLMSQLKDN